MSLQVDQPTGTADAPSQRRRQLLAGIAIVLVLGGAGAGILVLRHHDGKTTNNGHALPTADVVRTDLAEQTQADGTLGFAHTYTLIGGGSGHLTWLPQPADTMRRGTRVYAVDGHSVPLFYGATPFWRPLQSGMSDGGDVRELNRNLAALGYTDQGYLEVNDHFSAATRQAIEDWQSDLGVDQTGRVSPGDVVIEPGPIRINAVSATLGSPASGHLMTATDTTRQVTVNLPVSEEAVAAQDAPVGVQLPGGAATTGRISSFGTVASAGQGNQTGQGTQTATIPVYINLDHPGTAGRLDGAPVTVTFSSGTRKGVLAVPVNALLAKPDGSYMVEVVAAGRTRAVTVTLGAFSGGQVEVAGPGLEPGMKVEVPKS